MEQEYYIGSSKVVKVEPQAENWVHYDLEDGRSGLVRQEQFDAMRRTESYQDEMVMVYKWGPVTSRILQVLLEFDMPMSDMNFVVKQVNQSVIDNYEKAVSKLFKRQLTDHIRLSQIDEVLKTSTEVIKE